MKKLAQPRKVKYAPVTLSEDDSRILRNDQFPIAGIGTSAGGLEALEQFFANMPADSGLAFVIIQHLDPTHKGMMPELLQRITSMKVVAVTDGVIVKKNCLYVIPPNKSMSKFFAKLPDRFTIRAWIPACSGGDNANIAADVSSDHLNRFFNGKFT